MKISYTAAKKLISITELFIQTMIKSYKTLYQPKTIEEKMLWMEKVDENQKEDLKFHHIITAKLKNMVSFGAAFAT